MKAAQDPISEYLAALRKNLAQGDATEHTHRAALQRMVETIAPGVATINEAKKIECGAPDLTDEVARARYVPEKERVEINDDQYFSDVPSDIWQFSIGGYQVCEKWLKDRKGRVLNNDDIQHWQRMVVALAETRRLMAEIDALIPEWPMQ